MRVILFLTILCCCCRQLPAQQFAGDTTSFYFRHHLYLETPAVFLNAAGVMAGAGDTALAVHYIVKAATVGLADTLLITNDYQLQFIVLRKEWKPIRCIVLSNARNNQTAEKEAENDLQQEAVNSLLAPLQQEAIHNSWFIPFTGSYRRQFWPRLLPGSLAF